MRKFLFCFIMIQFLFGCATIGKEMNKAHKGIHPEFQVYVDEFVHISQGKLKKIRMDKLSMGFSKDYNPNTLGICFGLKNEIEINEIWWDQNPGQLAREALILHELGHCVLGRHHTEKTSDPSLWGKIESFFLDNNIYEIKPRMKDGCPSSIMHPYDISLKCYEKHQQYYKKELFNRKMKPE